MNRVFMFVIGLLLTLSAWGQTLFDSYFQSAKDFAAAFPREKVHLHFDNNSYYQGDTIWFKAYVATVGDNKLSRISKPLYVELIDQMGNIMDRQIVKLENGMGAGQLSLANTYFTGYYEVRAYTKWMLAFSDNSYFSRTLPIYRKMISDGVEKRSIAEYRMDESMQKRPAVKTPSLDVRFYPEGGHLVKGIPTTIGVETLSRDSGWVNISGVMTMSDGQKVPVATIHDGMGTFIYTPGDKPATIEFEYGKKKHSYKLPKAEDEGYGMRVMVKEDSYDVTVSRSATMPSSQLALFITVDGLPCSYVPVDLTQSANKRVKIMTDDLPVGVVQLSLINEQGNTIAERFCFSYPKDMPELTIASDREIYAPFDPVTCTVHVADANGKALAGIPLSVSVRDALAMDYRNMNGSIMTDMLLTCGLKGYINQPEFYFLDHTPAKRRMLDNLLLIRGWRQYDLDVALGIKPCQPKYLPEDKLTLYGKAHSYFQKSDNLGITILAHSDSMYISGATTTDSLGYFNVSIDDFEGKLDALIQTRKDGKKMNRAALVSIERRFEPEMRPLDYLETNPVWDDVDVTDNLTTLLHEADPYYDVDDEHVIGEVVVKGKKHGSRLEDTQKFERSIMGYYNIRQIVDEMRDEGKIITNDIGNLMHEINPKIDYHGNFYGTDSIIYSIEGKTLEKMYVDDCIDMIDNVVLYRDRTGIKYMRFNDETFRASEESTEDMWTGTSADTTSTINVRNMSVRLDFTMQERYQPGKNYVASRGVRKTYIQGYCKPVAFYTPQYTEPVPKESDNRRQTLYWTPEVVTDEEGNAHINCFNARNATYLDVHAETLIDGSPVAVSFRSYKGLDGK